MKWINKLFVAVFLFSLIFTSFSFAQTADTGTKEFPKVEEQKSTSQGIKVRFCDANDETLGTLWDTTIVVSPGKTYNLCLDLTNGTLVDTQIHVGFVDGLKDRNGNKICEEESKKAIFGQYVTGVEEAYILPPDTTKRLTAQIKMPASAAGTVYGCVTVFNEDIFDETKGAGFGTLIRNAIPLEVFVDSKVDVGLELAPVISIDGTNLVSDPIFVSKQANGTFMVAVGFKNIGGLDESVEVAGTITDTLKKVTELAPQTKIVSPEGNSDVRYEIPALPWYKMWFTVDMTVTHNAVSEFRTEFITDKLLEKKTITVSKTFFVFPWWLVGVLVVLALIIHLIKRSSKHHHDEEKELEELKKWKAEHGTPPQV